MRENLKRYLRKLFWAVVKGTAHGATAFLTLAGGHQLAPDIPPLNLKGLGCVVVGSAFISFFKFIDQTDPPDDTGFTPKTP